MIVVEMMNNWTSRRFDEIDQDIQNFRTSCSSDMTILNEIEEVLFEIVDEIEEVECMSNEDDFIDIYKDIVEKLVAITKHCLLIYKDEEHVEQFIVNLENFNNLLTLK